jgi:large subunit ribosomal protein L25
MAKPSILKTESRSGTGSSNARRDRVAGKVPVNIYGHGEENQNLAIAEHALNLALGTATQVFTLDIGGKQQPCLVKSVQYDTYGQEILHVDFARVSLTEEVEVEVPVHYMGHAKGITEGGQLVIQHPQLWVRCLAAAIPEFIEVEIADLGLGHSLHAGDVKLPAGVKLDTKRMAADEAVVGVVAPRVEAAPEVEAAPAEGAVVAPAAGEAGAAAPAAGGAEAKPGAAAAKPGAAPAKGAAPDKGGKKG